jgi:hypothetical protein
MKKLNLKRIMTLCLLLCIATVTHAQGTDNGTDFMRSHGRIYVVIAVILTILTGIILYLVRLEKKISKLEKGN